MEIKIDNEDEKKIISAISYIPFLFIIPLVLVKNDPFVHSHAKQGFVLFIFEVAIWVLGKIPLIGWLFKYFIGAIIFIIALYALIEALLGKFWKIPIIGDIAEEIKI
ncbi:MAG: hypothetical protein QMD25_04255 [Caldisericia bacterium]|jgi:uncharacterized membrane protein|nr:hypothetical protein [Caldisericia bacterium]